MPRFFPDRNCDFYAERLIDNCHSEQRHVLRKTPFENPICWFRDQDHEDPNRSCICSWGIGDNFMKNTGLNCEKFIKTRIRKNSSIPVAGRPALWKITRVGPCRLGKLSQHTWHLEDWLNQSSFRKSKTSVYEISKSRSST